MNPLAMTKLSPLASPGLRHLERAEPNLVSLGSASNSQSPALGSNQIWTGYRKGALKPIDAKVRDLNLDSGFSQDTDDLVLSSTLKALLEPCKDESVLFHSQVLLPRMTMMVEWK
jgi:hypothetical protein